MPASWETDTEAFSPTLSHIAFLPEHNNGSTERPEKLSIQPGVKDIYPQIVASCIAHMLVIQAGINMSYSAILLPQLIADPTFPITKDEGSWVASLMAIATPVGSLVCGPFMDMLGRKLFSVVATVPIIASWTIMVFTPNIVWPLYIARILAGIGGGLTTVSMVYISEISNSSWRPMLLCLNSVFVSLGILLTNFLGVILPWRIVAMLAGCLAIFSAAAIAFYNPESPYWLLKFRSGSRIHIERAKQALQYLNPNQKMFSTEWNRLVKSSQQKPVEEGAEETEVMIRKVKQSVGEFTKRSSLLPFILLLTIFFFQQLSGTYPIIFYAVQVFQSIGGNFGPGLNADSATVILGMIRFVTSLVTAGLSRSYGRRPLFIMSGTGMTLSGFIAAIYFQRSCSFASTFNQTISLVSNTSSVLNITNCTISVNNINSTLLPPGDNSDALSHFIGLACILLFVTMSSLGVLIIPWTLIGEILPLSVRGIGGGLMCSYAYILMFGIVKVFPFMLDIFSISGLFYFFCFTSFLNVVVVYFFLPETLGKSFEEIEKSFMRTPVIGGLK